ncbi:MAG: hypothetical protein LC792_18170 [Actinobacteria bacterium]|nr:hypothetical protein [Actinomycetota bacterium]
MTGRRRPRTVIYGPYPPIPGASATATLEQVRRILASGNEVRVISPTPSAAHDHADLRQPKEAWRFARKASGAAQLTVHLDADLIASAGHRQELPARLALAAAVRSAGRSTVYLPRGHDQLPAGWARVVDGADEVLAEVEELPETSPESRPTTGRMDWNLAAAPTRDELEAEIRRRAMMRRTAQTDGGRERASAIAALRAVPRLHPAAPRSANPLVAVVKRIVRRLVAWQIDPVIEHVNLLQWAVTEAGPQPPADDTSP